MSLSQAQRVAFLARMALFRGLTEEDLAAIAARLVEFNLPAGELLYAAGDRADNFYLVHGGALISWPPGDEAEAAPLESGDCFGQGALLDGGPRQFSVSAHTDCTLLYLPRSDFEWLLADYPQVAESLAARSAGDDLKLEVDFDWLREGENVYHVARKHAAYLWWRWGRSLVVALFAMFTLYSATTAGPEGQFRWVAAGGGLLFLAVAIAVWEYLDWRNDFYILTNLRVIWLEQVLLRSSSRKEAPLESIQSVNVHTNLLGRIVNFGDLIVRTYTGTVLMPAVGDPQHIKHLIEEYVARLRQKTRAEKHETIRQAVRESLGQPVPAAAPAPDNQHSPEMIENPPRFQLFKTRHVDGPIITYHKHWFVLFSSLLLPAFFLVAVFYALRTLYGGLPPTATDWLIASAFVLLPIGVIIYRFLDWQNDIYRVTPDSLIDSEKKPLGSEVTKSASLANVLSLENHRVGILGLLLNFGVVRINVGDTSLEFMDVHNPALIQQDIFLRMEALKQTMEEKQASEERQRMTEWLKVYEEERGGRKDPNRR